MEEKVKPHELSPSRADLQKLIDCAHGDPHSVLGMHLHPELNALVIRCFDVRALGVAVVSGEGERREMDKIHPAGLFAAKFTGCDNYFPYQLEHRYEDSTFTAADPYSFLLGIGDLDTHLFNEGEHRKVYEFMGAHPRRMGGVDGVLFSVWAPNASRVSVIGDFNGWDGRRHPMRMVGISGIWELFIPGIVPGDLYKFELRTANGNIFIKSDPYAFQWELRPRTGSVVADLKKLQWSDESWMEKRTKKTHYETPMLIYEVHLASWRGPGLRPIDPNNEDDFHNYRDIAHALADYVLEMGFTHVELLPVAEHPFDLSWGYQVTGFFAPTSRHGTPEDFAYFVNHMHHNGIGVILDWVPAHFPKDDFSLGRFDGTALYEHQDPRQGEHRDWGTYIFNYGRNEVRNFLIGNALFWLEKFHIDGLRVDAVASMLYLNYSREDGDWVANEHGGKENIHAIKFMRRLNELTNELHPGTLMIAEESTAWAGVSRPVYLGGLGYSFKWNMGWMHDTLKYFALEPIYRSYHHHDLTFSMLYAFSENFVLPLSHDEVVHGKRSLLDKMSGDYWQKFANLRALYGYMITHPGKKLLFMGCEFGQWNEWNCKVGLDWNLLGYPAHESLQRCLMDLNCMYHANPALWNNELSYETFEWIDANDTSQSVFSYVRWDKDRHNPLVVVVNLTPVVRDQYRIGVPKGGCWREIMNTDRNCYGGSGVINEGELFTEPVPFHARPFSVSLKLPPLGVCVLRAD